MARHLAMTRGREGGQVLVLVVLAMVVLLVGAALVIDGGNAFAQQRMTQNASDSAANAGALALMQDVVANNNGQSTPNGDAEVAAAINQKASQNGIAQPTAFYTTISGQCILTSGQSSPQPCTTAGGAIQVGSAPGGAIPTVLPDSQGKRQCPLAPGVPDSTPALACGVVVYGSKTFGTYLSGVAGLSTFTASAGATAVAGALTTLCAAGEPCTFLPITFPTSLTLCDGSGKQLNFGNDSGYSPITNQPLTAANEQIIGICGSGDGTVGWLAIQPEDSGAGCNGSNPDLVCDILTPDNPPLTLPVWIETVAGNTNDNNVDQAVNTYAGNIVGTYEFGLDKIVLIPLYDCTGTDESQTSTDSCQQAAQKQGGTNIWFHIVAVGAFALDHAYIQSSNPECNQVPGSPFIGGNGKNGCFKGWLVDVSSPTGVVGAGDGKPNSVFGVQLIR